MATTMTTMTSESLEMLRHFSAQLGEMKQQVDALLSGSPAPVAGKAGKKAAKADKPKRTHAPSEFSLSMKPVTALCKEILGEHKHGLPMRVAGWLRNKEIHGDSPLEANEANVRAALAFFESNPDYKSKAAKAKAEKPAEPAPAAPAASEGAAAPAAAAPEKKPRKNPWDGLTEEQKKERVAKMQAAKKAKKEAGVAAPAAAAAPAPVAAAPAVTFPIPAARPTPAAEEEMEEVTLQPFTVRGKNYLRTEQYELWVQEEDGTQGEWVGVYDPVTKKIDITAEEPVLE